MSQSFFLIAVATSVALTQASVCSEIGNSVDCISTGCRWSGSCQQPTACASNRQRVYSSHDGVRKNTGLYVDRKPLSPEIARLCDTKPFCTAMYYVVLDRAYTTGSPNCNDYAMLPPHGVDQTTCATDNSTKDHWASYASTLKNYENHPLPNDSVEQSLAKAKGMVTALTVDTTNCWQTDHCAFPYGYYSDTIKKSHGICVEVRNTYRKWVEIMASGKGGSDSSFCVKDMDDVTDSGDKGCTKTGDLVDHRESGVTSNSASMNIMFYTEDNFDDANIDFWWRIAASYEPSRDGSVAGEEKDAEDWSQYRDGGQYPLALMQAYPIGYDEPSVFNVTSEDSAAFTAPALFTVLFTIFCGLFL